MQDTKYCYPNSDVLINKLNIIDSKRLFEAEKELTFIRLKELQSESVKGNFDFEHLKKIHKYIFQDLYSWAGQPRTVEIGKGNLFCTTNFLQEYADSVFQKYYKQCYAARESKENFVKTLAENYGDLNALHPFREGNGRTQREFARNVCAACGYSFSLQTTTHKEMLEASKLSFDKGDNSLLEKIFSNAVEKIEPVKEEIYQISSLDILCIDDLKIEQAETCEYREDKESERFNPFYETKIQQMDEQAEDLYQCLDEVLQSAKEAIIHSPHKTQPEKLNEDIIR